MSLSLSHSFRYLCKPAALLAVALYLCSSFLCIISFFFMSLLMSISLCLSVPPPPIDRRTYPYVSCEDGWSFEWMDGWMDAWMHGWMHGCMDGWMDGRMDGWICACVIVFGSLTTHECFLWVPRCIYTLRRKYYQGHRAS